MRYIYGYLIIILVIVIIVVITGKIDFIKKSDKVFGIKKLIDIGMSLLTYGLMCMLYGIVRLSSTSSLPIGIYVMAVVYIGICVYTICLSMQQITDFSEKREKVPAFKPNTMIIVSIVFQLFFVC